MATREQHNYKLNPYIAGVGNMISHFNVTPYKASFIPKINSCLCFYDPVVDIFPLIPQLF